MMLMPEVAVLSLTLSEAHRPQLVSPAWILGARPVMTGRGFLPQIEALSSLLGIFEAF